MLFLHGPLNLRLQFLLTSQPTPTGVFYDVCTSKIIHFLSSMILDFHSSSLFQVFHPNTVYTSALQGHILLTFLLYATLSQNLPLYPLTPIYILTVFFPLLSILSNHSNTSPVDFHCLSFSLTLITLFTLSSICLLIIPMFDFEGFTILTSTLAGSGP